VRPSTATHSHDVRRNPSAGGERNPCHARTGHLECYDWILTPKNNPILLADTEQMRQHRPSKNEPFFWIEKDTVIGIEYQIWFERQCLVGV
jgi:hypothetical protein